MEDITIKLTVEVEESVRQVSDFVKKAKDSLETQLPRSVEKAKQSLEDLGRKMQSVSQIIEADKRRIDELTKKREEASGQQKRQIDAELEGLKRVASGREVELLKLKEKQAKVEEIIKLSTAGSAEEEAAIKKATQARLSEIGALKDQTRAQMGVKDSTDKADESLKKYITSFATLGTAAMAVRTITQAIQEQKQAWDNSMSALQRMQEQAKSQQDKARSFYQEWGLAGGDDQQKAQGILAQIGKQNNLGQDTIISAASALAPYMKAKGIDYASKQGQEIIANFAAGTNMGIDANAGAQVIGDMLTSSTTGQQVNTYMAAVLNGAGGGSASRANAILQTWAANKHKFEAVGMGFNDVVGIGGQLGKKYSAETAQEVLGSIAEGADRLLGISPEQLAVEHMALQDFDPMAKRIIEENASVMPFDQRIKVQMQNRRHGIPELDQWYSDAIKAAQQGKSPDIAGYMNILKKLSPDQQARALRTFAGPRKTAPVLAALHDALNAGGLSYSGSIPFPSHPADVGAALGDAAVQGLTQNVDADFTAMGKEIDTLAAQYDATRTGERSGQYGAQKVADNVATLGMHSVADPKEAATAMLLTQRLIALAQIREEIASGKRAATPDQIQQLESTMNAIVTQMKPSSGFGGAMFTKLQALASGEAGGGWGSGTDKQTRSKVLHEIQKMGSEKWRYQNIPWDELNMNLRKSDDLLPIYKDANQLLGNPPAVQSPQPTQPTTAPSTQHPPQPATQPSTPISVNYHQRIVNYGYGVDSIGAPAEIPNYFG